MIRLGTGALRTVLPPDHDAFESRQRRLLMISTAVNTLGNGAYLPMALLVLTTLTGLPLITVGIVLTSAELCALPLMPLTGAVVDRIGARRTQTVCHAARCSGFAAYIACHSIGTLVLAAVLVAAAERSSRVAGPALIAETLRGGARERYLVLDRALSNAGLGVGGVVAAALVTMGGRASYVGVALVTSTAFGVAALVTGRLRCVTCGDAASQPVRGGWHAVAANRPFRLMTLANGCSAFGYVALAMLIPIYAITALHLPAPLGGALFTLNTVVVAAGSVPISTWLDRHAVSSDTRACLGLLLMAAGFVVMGAAAMPGRHGVAAVLVVVAVLIYTVGEIVHAPAATSLVLAAAGDGDRGRYLGVYQLSWASAAAVAPAAFTVLVARCPLVALGGLVLLDLAAVALLRRSRRPNVSVRLTLAGTRREVGAAGLA